MKIKAQFRLLIISILIAPILAILGQMIFSEMQKTERVVPMYEEVAPLISNFATSREWRIISMFLRTVRTNTVVAIFRADFTVIYSTFDFFVVGETINGAEIFDAIGNTDSRYKYSFESYLLPTANEPLYLFQRIDRDVRTPFPFITLGSTCILLFMIFMSLAIAHSVTSSMSKLEEATRHIASGDLDQPVVIKEQKFLRRNNEITSLAKSLNQMRLALKEDGQRRARFIMGVTHDLKTPLALIKGYTEALEDGIADDPESQKRSLSIIVSKVDQLEGMIDDLLNFVRFDTGEWRQALAPVNLSAFLRSYAKRIIDDAELMHRRIETCINIPDGLLTPMDERLVLRALENLTNNALRYTSPDSLVALNAYTEANHAVIEVRDNGPGIAETELPYIFDTFYRGSNSRREQGMGLGLSVVKGVADSHGWTIAAFNRPTGGSVFTITIPLETH
ncbi:MAG: HAMP domain-containing histidine kinase [Treponema sp.]|jgi:signal transduction histidine kinase|nr:HAMP domain-containing histidine kinase [Treponema sp.]